MDEKRVMMCSRCNVELKPIEANFSYLDHSFRAQVPRCPDCGQVFIPESLAKGRIADVEMELEDK